MDVTDVQALAMGAGGAGLVFSLAGLLIRSLFNAASKDEDYREELRKRDEAREAELAERKREYEDAKGKFEEAKAGFEADRRQWWESERTLQRRLFELEAKVSAQDLIIAQLTSRRDAS